MQGKQGAKLALVLAMGLNVAVSAGSQRDRNWLKGKAGGDGALAFYYNAVYLVELSDGNKQKVGNGRFPEFSLDASILAWQDGGDIKGRLRKGDTNVKTLTSGVENGSGVHWISAREFVCRKGGKYKIVDAYTGNEREDSELNKIDMSCDNEGDVKRCSDGVWVVINRNNIKMSNGSTATRPGACSGSLSPDGRSATGLERGHDKCTLRGFRDGGYSGSISRTVGDCGDKGFDNHRWSSNSKNFVVAQWECQNKVGVWEIGSSDVCILADCGGETYGDFTVGSPKVTSWGSSPDPEPDPEPEPDPDPTDNTKPSKPGNLSGNAAGSSQIDLSWDAASDGESGVKEYNVYRDGNKVGTTDKTNYSDQGLEADRTYKYRVAAVNGADMEGDKSDEVSVQTEQGSNPEPEPDPDPSQSAGTLIDYDFTQMNSAPSNCDVKNGEWTGDGWKVNRDARMCVNLGQKLEAGKAEIVVTISTDPSKLGGKRNYFCISELSEPSHNSDGSKAYLRSGEGKYRFSKFKAYWKGFDHGEFERSLGETSDWNTDGTTEHRISIAWDENDKLSVKTPGGDLDVEMREFSEIQYIFLGSYHYDGVLETMVFKSLTVTTDSENTAMKDHGVPAPAFGNATVRFSTDNGMFVQSPEASILTVSDLNGRVARMMPIPANAGTVVGGAAFPCGVYIVRLVSQQNNAVLHREKITRR